MEEIEKEADRLIELYRSSMESNSYSISGVIKCAIIDVSNTIELIIKIEDNYYCGNDVLSFHKQVKELLESKI
jgi:hypothetical protein